MQKSYKEIDRKRSREVNFEPSLDKSVASLVCNLKKSIKKWTKKLLKETKPDLYKNQLRRRVTNESFCERKSRTFDTQCHRNLIIVENLKTEKICEIYDFLQALDRI